MLVAVMLVAIAVDRYAHAGRCIRQFGDNGDKSGRGEIGWYNDISGISVFGRV